MVLYLNLENFNTLIFDMDGTMLNSYNQVVMCLEKAFEKENLSIDKSRITPNIIGPPLVDIVLLVKPDLDLEIAKNVVIRYREFYDNDENDSSQLYEGIYEFLHKLKKRNKKLFVATNKPKYPTLRLLKKYNIDMFDDVYTLDKFQNKIISKKEMISDIILKHKINCEKAIMIGDALGDVLSAQANGIKAIGALWGYGDNKQPLIDNADYISNDVHELISCLLN